MITEFGMENCYKKLGKNLIDLEPSRTELRLCSRISSVSLAKWGNNDNPATFIGGKICHALNYDIGDIIDFLRDEEDADA